MLAAGGRYVGTQTGTLLGVRFQNDFEFTASRDQEPEPFVRDRAGVPDQDRVFVVDPLGHGSVPRLVVAGSIRPAVEPSPSHVIPDDRPTSA